MPANLRKGSLGVQVLGDGHVIYRFKLQIFGGSRRGGGFLLEGCPGIRGSLISVKGMDESEVNGHGESAETLVIGVMPGVDPRLVGYLASGIVNFGGRLLSRYGPPCTNGAEVASDEWGSLEVVGAFESGDMANKSGGGAEHFEKGWFWNKRHQTFNDEKQGGRWHRYVLHDALRAWNQ